MPPSRVSNSDIKFRNSEIEFQYRFRNPKLVNSDILETLIVIDCEIGIPIEKSNL